MGSRLQASRLFSGDLATGACLAQPTEQHGYGDPVVEAGVGGGVTGQQRGDLTASSHRA